MRWGILAFLFILQMVNFADKSVAGYAAVPIMKEFDLSYSQWGLVGSSFFWFFSIASMIGAGWSDKIGTKKMLALMAMSWTVLQFGAFVIFTFPLLVLSRVLLGAFEGPYYATAVTQVSKWFTPQSRSFAISIMNFGGTIGALVSAPLLVYLIETFSWRIAFSILGAISLIWFILWTCLGKEKPENQIEHIQEDSKMSRPQMDSERINWSKVFKVFRTPTFIFSSLAAFSSYWILSWITVWMPAYLVKAIQISPIQMGYASSIIGLVGGFMLIGIALFSDRLFKKHQSFRKSHVLVGTICLVLSGLVLYSITIFHSPFWVIIVLCILKALPYTINLFAPQIAMSLYPERAGLMTGALWGFATLAGIVGPYITGLLVELAGNNVTLGFDYGIQFAGTLLLVFGILFFIFVKRDEKIISSFIN